MSFRAFNRWRPGHNGLAVLAIGLALTLAACGATETIDSESEIPVGFPTIAPAEVNGVYELTSVQPSISETTDIAFTATPSAELDVVTGTLAIDTACNRYLGSFSLEDDGRASFTITGGTSDECPAEVADQDDLMLEVLAATDQWSQDGGNLLFSGTAGPMTWTRS